MSRDCLINNKACSTFLEITTLPSLDAIHSQGTSTTEPRQRKIFELIFGAIWETEPSNLKCRSKRTVKWSVGTGYPRRQLMVNNQRTLRVENAASQNDKKQSKSFVSLYKFLQLHLTISNLNFRYWAVNRIPIYCNVRESGKGWVWAHGCTWESSPFLHSKCGAYQ